MKKSTISALLRDAKKSIQYMETSNGTGAYIADARGTWCIWTDAATLAAFKAGAQDARPVDHLEKYHTEATEAAQTCKIAYAAGLTLHKTTYRPALAILLDVETGAGLAAVDAGKLAALGPVALRVRGELLPVYFIGEGFTGILMPIRKPRSSDAARDLDAVRTFLKGV